MNRIDVIRYFISYELKVMSYQLRVMSCAKVGINYELAKKERGIDYF